MIHFFIDQAGFSNKLTCGTVNYFDGWVVNSSRGNPIVSVRFSVGDNPLGSILVKKERPDLEKDFGKTLVGFSGVIDISEIYVGQVLRVEAVARDGELFFLNEYELNDKLSLEEIEFRKNNKLPDDILMHLVVHNVNPRTFLDEGRAGFELIREILSKHGAELAELRNVLDFGVGCGRILRWWKDYSSSVHLWGTDINPILIDWCKNNLPFGDFGTNTILPPTRYKDSQFDLVYAFSVFTHLTQETQEHWLAEFSRIVGSGKFLLVSVHGDYHAKFLAPNAQEAYERKGYYVLTKDAEGENLCATYQNRELCVRLFSRHFDVLEYHPEALTACGNQDLYLLRSKKI